MTKDKIKFDISVLEKRRAAQIDSMRRELAELQFAHDARLDAIDAQVKSDWPRARSSWPC